MLCCHEQDFAPIPDEVEKNMWMGRDGLNLAQVFHSTPHLYFKYCQKHPKPVVKTMVSFPFSTIITTYIIDLYSGISSYKVFKFHPLQGTSSLIQVSFSDTLWGEAASRFSGVFVACYAPSPSPPWLDPSRPWASGKGFNPKVVFAPEKIAAESWKCKKQVCPSNSNYSSRLKLTARF